VHAPALTLKDFCDAYRVCRETAYQQIRTGRLRAVKLGRKTLILRADADAWAASLRQAVAPKDVLRLASASAALVARPSLPQQ